MDSLSVSAYSGGGSDDATSRKKRIYHRHDSKQRARLEQIFKECPHPDDRHRRKIGRELGMEARQVKFWFQNKRTQMKSQSERSDNTSLRIENAKMKSENFLLKEALKNITCLTCRGQTSEKEECNLIKRNLKLKNAMLHEEHRRLSKFLAENGINNNIPPVPSDPTLESPCDPSSSNQNMEIPTPGGQHIPSPFVDQNIPSTHYTPTLDQHITNHAAPTPSVDQQDIPPLTPALDQNFSATHDQDDYIPDLSHIVSTPALDQDFSAIAPSAPGQNIPSDFTHDAATPPPPLDHQQHFSAVSPAAPDQNIQDLPLDFDKDFSAITLGADQNIPAHTTHHAAVTPPAFDGNFPVHSVAPDQNINPALPPGFEQNVSAITPAPHQNGALDQTFPAITSAAPDQDPVLPPGFDQDFSAFTPAQDQNIPSDLPHHAHDHDIPALICAIDKDFSVAEQDNSVLTSAPFDQETHNVPQQDVSAPTSSFGQDYNPVLSPPHDQHIPTIDQDEPDLNIDFHKILGANSNEDNNGSQHVEGLVSTVARERYQGSPDKRNMLTPRPMSITTTVSTNREKVLMKEIASTAMEELKRLLSTNEPLWYKSIVDGKFILQREAYEKIFCRSNCLKGPYVRKESSKDSRIVSMGATQLVEMFLNSEKWVDHFPTIVKRAQTIKVFESGSLGKRDGALQLMNAEMHILSPLVPTRKFVFVRYCKQVDGAWVIADVSCDSPVHDDATLPRAWRFPSGCLIQEISNGSCRVTWVENVEVDDKMQTHWLFREVICGNCNVYGAERWVLTLERMCERFTKASLENIPICDNGGVISSTQGRRSVMELAHRMVKMFYGTLDLSDKKEFPHLTRQNNNNNNYNEGVRVSVRTSTEPGVPHGVVIGAATSFRLPLSPQNVFCFLRDNNIRLQWDVLCNGNAAHEIQHISNGINPGNCTSVIRPFVPKENDMLIVQESYIDPLGSMLVYAPIDIATLGVAMKGEDSSELPILPSGFTISGDGHRSNAVVDQTGKIVGTSEGSLVTLVFQLLACTPSGMDKLSTNTVASVKTLVTTIVERIKVALNCSNLE